jgi:hypothetical protein
MQLVRVASSQKIEELRIRMREQAYLGWLIYLLQPIAIREHRMTFQEWLRGLGLAEGEEKVEDLESMKKKALQIAERIVEMDKKHRS